MEHFAIRKAYMAEVRETRSNLWNSVTSADPERSVVVNALLPIHYAVEAVSLVLVSPVVSIITAVEALALLDPTDEDFGVRKVNETKT